jgi:hypothetical protein
MTHAGTARLVTSTPPQKKRKQKDTSHIVEHLHMHLLRASKRLVKHAARAGAYGFPPGLKIAESIESASRELEAAFEALERVPTDWSPIRGTARGIALEEGALVEVIEKHRGKRVELTDKGCTLKIVRVAGGKAVCEVDSGADKGIRVVIPGAQLRRVEK